MALRSELSSAETLEIVIISLNEITLRCQFGGVEREFGAISQRLSDEFRDLSGYIKSEICDANVSLG